MAKNQDWGKRLQTMQEKARTVEEGMVLCQSEIIRFVDASLHLSGATRKELAKVIEVTPQQLTAMLKLDANLTANSVTKLYWAFGRRPKIVFEKF